MTAGQDASRLIENLFAAIDSMDIDGFLACIGDEARFRFGSAEPLCGHAGIRTAVDAFFASIAGLNHRIARSIADGPVLVAEGEVTYARHDGSDITLPFVNVFEVEGGLITDYRIYIDIAPLYSA